MTRGEMERVDWKEDAPHWEERRGREEEFQVEIREVMRIGAFRDRIDSARERMNSGKPVSEEELIIVGLEASIADLPDAAARELSLGVTESEVRRLPDDDILAPLSAAEEADLAGFTVAPALHRPGPKSGR